MTIVRLMTRRKAFFIATVLVLVLIAIYHRFLALFSISDTEVVAADHIFENKTLILMWTPVFGARSLWLDDSCDLADCCQVTYDRNAFETADAVVYHLFDVKFFNMPMRTNASNQRTIHTLLSQESYLNSVSALRQMPNLENYFHWIMSYMRNSHVPYVYGGYWTRPEEAASRGFFAEPLPHTAAEILANKSRAVFWTVSNCKTSSRREVAVQALKRHLQIDVFGNCTSDLSLISACPRNRQNDECDRRFRSYYFVIIAENSICRDYVTEKYWDRYRMPVVPLVIRRHVYKDLLPTDSFIAFDDFDGPKAMADYLRYLMATPDAYLRYFRWRTEGWARARWNAPGYRIGLCNLCAKLLERKASRPVERLPTIPDVAAWMAYTSVCEDGKFASRWAEGRAFKNSSTSILSVQYSQRKH